jgi:hypothetical protein
MSIRSAKEGHETAYSLMRALTPDPDTGYSALAATIIAENRPTV